MWYIVIHKGIINTGSIKAEKQDCCSHSYIIQKVPVFAQPPYLLVNKGFHYVRLHQGVLYRYLSDISVDKFEITWLYKKIGKCNYGNFCGWTWDWCDVERGNKVLYLLIFMKRWATTMASNSKATQLRNQVLSSLTRLFFLLLWMWIKLLSNKIMAILMSSEFFFVWPVQRLPVEYKLMPNEIIKPLTRE